MNRSDTAKCYALVCGAYSAPPDEVNVEAWYLLLRHLNADLAMEATRRLCLRDSPFPPRPGEIAAEARRILGDEPPSVDAALGLYAAGEKDTHPLVRAAADRCYWRFDRDDADKVRFEFRDAYQAVLYKAEDDAREPSRAALGIESVAARALRELPVPVRADPQCEICSGFGWREVHDGTPGGAMGQCDCMRRQMVPSLRAVDSDR